MAKLPWQATQIQRPPYAGSGSKCTRGSKTLAVAMVFQKKFRANGPDVTAPVRSRTSTWVLSVVMTFVGPTAPWVSGGMAPLLSPRPWKLTPIGGASGRSRTAAPTAWSGAGGGTQPGGIGISGMSRCGRRALGGSSSARGPACRDCSAARSTSTVPVRTGRTLWPPIASAPASEANPVPVPDRTSATSSTARVPCLMSASLRPSVTLRCPSRHKYSSDKGFHG